MSQDLVPDLNAVAQWLADFYEDLRGIRSTTAAPEHYSVDPDLMRQWHTHIDQRRTDMNNQLAWFRRLMEEEYQLSNYIPDVLEGKDLPLENPITNFKTSQLPLDQRLTKVDQAYMGSFEIVAGLIEDTIAKYEHDLQLVAQATEKANAGDYKHASDIMGGATRIFKNVAYWQPDRHASKMASLLDTVAKDFAMRQRKFEDLIAKLEDKKNMRTDQLTGEARTLISEASAELMKARKAFPEVSPDSPFATELARLENQIIPWQGEQAARLDAVTKSGQKFRTQMVRLGIAGAVLLVALVVAFLWMRTGYRIVSPTGKEHTASFLLPGTYSQQFEVEGYQPYKAQIPVSFGSYNDMGQVSVRQLKPLTGKAILGATPGGATYVLRGLGNNSATRKGKLPANHDDLPVGDYELTITLGDYSETHKLSVSKDKPFQKAYSLGVGALNLTSTPEGAKVALDGKQMGVTPYNLSSLQPGQHEVVLTLEGNSIALPFEVKAGEVTELNHTFGYGSVKLTTDPPGARLSFPDAPTIPSTIAPWEESKIFARTYKVKVEYPGLEPKEFEVNVETDGRTEQQLALDYATLLLDAKPRLGTGMAVEDMTDPGYSGKAPFRTPPLKPGTYKIRAQTASKEKMFREVEATNGMRDEQVVFEFANGSLKLQSQPAGIKVSIPELNVYNESTPADLPNVVVGDYTATYNHGSATIRRKFTVDKGKETVVQANFVDSSLKDRTDIKVYQPRTFHSERVITRGVGLQHARVGGPLEPALKAYGKPESVRKLPNPEKGSMFILSYPKVGLSIITDGTDIEALNFVQVPSSAPNRPPPAYWARTEKGITIGDSDEKLLRAYGKQAKSSGNRGLDYDGIVFGLRGTEGGGREVYSIRVTVPEKPIAPEGGTQATPSSP